MSQHTIGYTGPVRRGYALKPPPSNQNKLEDLTEPCPTCGQEAVRQTYESTRKDGVYRVTQLRCPSANTRRAPKNGYERLNQSQAPKCPIHITEIKIGDTMPVQKICTVIPKPEDQAEYKRLKAVLKLENQEFVKLCLLTNSPVYDWFAGRAISPQTEAKILHAIKELQKRELKREGKPVVKPAQIDEPCKQADPDPQAETKSNTPKWYTPIEVLDRLTASMQSAEQRLAVLEHETNGLATSRELEGEQADSLDDRVTNLEQRLEQIEDDEPLIEDEQLDRIQVNPPRNQHAKAALCVELLTPMSHDLVDCILEVVKANRQLSQALG